LKILALKMLVRPSTIINLGAELIKIISNAIALRFLLMLALALNFPFVAHAQNNSSPKSTPELRRTFSATPIPVMPATSEIAGAWEKSDVWISPVLRQQIDSQKIARVLRAAGSSAKVAVLQTLPQNQTAHDFAQGWQSQTSAELVIVVYNRPRNVGLGGVLDEEKLAEIAAGSARTFDSEGAVAGVAQLLRVVGHERARRERSLRMTWILGIGVPLIFFLWFARRARKMRLADLKQSRDAAQELRARLEIEVEKWESDAEYALIAESDATRREALKAARTRAEAAWNDALKRLKSAQNAAEFERAQTMLRSASSEVQRARSLLDLRPVEMSTQIVQQKSTPE